MVKVEVAVQSRHSVTSILSAITEAFGAMPTWTNQVEGMAVAVLDVGGQRIGSVVRVTKEPE